MKNNKLSFLQILFYGTRSFLFYAGYNISAIIYAPIVLAIGPLLSFEKRSWLVSRWCWFIMKWLRITCGISVQTEYLVDLKSIKPCIVLSNHQSSWEALFLQLLFNPSATVLKKELLNIPFFGWGLRLMEPITIDRKKPRLAGKAFLEQGTQAVNKGRWIVLFPEGTRVAPGETAPLNIGGFKLAANTKTPVVPVYHNAGECWPPRKFIKFPGVIKCTVGRPLQPEGLPRDIMQNYEKVMGAMSGYGATEAETPKESTNSQ
ncbi:MAG: lysophospholipid acyltransferase family protein [Pseudomonadota bacterium]|nr:lysophospholipid acyltransferase family protein [Pseudomonadota bacterium]